MSCSQDSTSWWISMDSTRSRRSVRYFGSVRKGRQIGCLYSLCCLLRSFALLGDCYMVTSIPSYQNPENAAAAMCHFSLDMIAALKQFNVEHPANKLDLRVGINTGPVVAGVVGTSRFLYDLWGDAVNVVSIHSTIEIYHPRSLYLMSHPILFL